MEAECKKVHETIAATVKTFPQAFKTALINSYKKKYLTVHDGKFVPLTTKIRQDITILQKYYNGKIPNDIKHENSLFPAIITEANKQLSVKSFTIEQKLEETLSSVHRHITSKHTCSGDTTCITLDSSPEVETTLSSHIEFSTPMCMVTSASLLNTSSRLVMCSHLHSPPNKIAKPSNYCHSEQSQLDTMVSNFQMLNLPGKDHQRSNKDNTCRGGQLSQASFTQLNTNECMQNKVRHVINAHALVISKKPMDIKPQSGSNIPTPTISMPTSPSYSPNQNMFSQTPQPYFPYMFLPPPQYPYTVPPHTIPTTNPHSPHNLKPWPKLNVAPSDHWMYSHFNFRPSLKDTKIPTCSPWPSGQSFPFHDKLQTNQYNFSMTLPHSPYPWYPSSFIS